MLNSGKEDQIWFDDSVPGFGLRIREAGSRSSIFQYKMGRKTRRVVIGHASAIKVGRAREIAGELHAKVRLGGDPAADKRIKVERALAHARWLGGKIPRPAGDRVAVRQLPGGQPPSSGARQTTARPACRYDRPANRGPPVAHDQEKLGARDGRNRVRASLSAMFTWGIKEGLVLANPVTLTNKRQEKSRDRVLVDAELRCIWRALADNQYGTIIKLLVLTAQRANEIAALRWEEINFDRNVISLPGSRTKNGRPHEIPMSVTVRSLLLFQPRIDGRDLVFGKRDGPFSGFSRCKKALDKKIAELTGGKALAPWVHHDLRRSAATGMADNGIQPHVVEAVLNHTSGHKAGVAGVYNRASYAAEKAQALARWDEHMASMVHEYRNAVTPLRGRV